MEKISIKVILDKHGQGLPLPAYATSHSAGADLYAAVEFDLTIKPGESAMVPTGLHFEIPEGFEVQVRPRSGLAAKNQVTVLNSPGTIDSDYRGEVKVILINHGKAPFIVKRGDRIAQMVVGKVEQASFEKADSLSETSRGHGGFGSTGKN